MNIEDKSNIHCCTSCQVCAAVCPKDAISISLNYEGFYRPKVDYNKCIDCGICVDVCYKYDKEIAAVKKKDLTKNKVYAACSKDPLILEKTSSGGIADVLCRSLIQRGFKCVGVEYDINKNRAVAKVADNIKDTVGFIGSKYIQPYTLDALSEILRKSKNKDKIAVFGLPCHIYAVNQAIRRLKLERDRFLLIDFFCHGCPTINLWLKYLKEVEKNEYDKVEFRSKIKGWGRYIVNISKKEKPVFLSSRKKDEFYKLFFSDHVLNKACHSCKIRSTYAYCDIRLGDFWGKSYDKNNSGMSLVVTASEKGEKYLASIKSEIKIIEHNHSDYLPYQSFGRVYYPNLDLRNKMLRDVADKDKTLKTVVRYYYKNQNSKDKLKRYIKDVLTVFPKKWILGLKNIYHHINHNNKE